MIDEFPNMMIIVLKISFSFSSTCHTRREEKKSEMSIFNPFFLISSKKVSFKRILVCHKCPLEDQKT